MLRTLCNLISKPASNCWGPSPRKLRNLGKGSPMRKVSQQRFVEHGKKFRIQQEVNMAVRDDMLLLGKASRQMQSQAAMLVNTGKSTQDRIANRSTARELLQLGDVARRVAGRHRGAASHEFRSRRGEFSRFN